MNQLLDFTKVENYLRISPKAPDNVIISMPASDLLKQENVRVVLDTYGKTVKAIGDLLPGSFLGVTLCNFCLTQFVFNVKDHVFLDLSPENLLFYLEDKGTYQQFGYQLTNIVTKEIPLEHEEEFLLENWSTFITEQILPLLNSITNTANIKNSLIFNQFGSQFSYTQNMIATNFADESTLKRLDMYIDILTEKLSPEIFGVRKNPFKHSPCFIESPCNPDEKWMIKSGCCWWDKREDGVKCVVCPRN